MKNRAYAYQTGIQAYCQRVIDAFHPDCIILHGSVARGQEQPHSDVDILVIGGALPDNFFERIYALNRLRVDETPIEVIGYTRPEWEAMMKSFHLTVLESLEWGLPLYGEALFDQWKARLEAWKRAGLKRGKWGWDASPVLLRDAG